MSWRASAYVIDVLSRQHPWLSVSHIGILLAIAARHHQDDHCAWGQLQRLSEDTHASVSTLSRLIGELEDGGVVAVWEGYLPRRKGEPADARRRRSLLFTFPGLDQEDGPPYDNVQRHIRHGGAGMHESVADSATQFEPACQESLTACATDSACPDGDQLQRSASPELLHEQVLNVFIPAGIPDATQSVAVPLETPAGTRARDEAAPPRAAPDGPDQPRPLRQNAQECPICRKPFVGPYDEHTAAAHKVRSRAEPGNVPVHLVRPPTQREIAADLERMAQERAQLAAQMPPELRAELEAEHERMLARERARASPEPAGVGAEASP